MDLEPDDFLQKFRMMPASDQYNWVNAWHNTHSVWAEREIRLDEATVYTLICVSQSAAAISTLFSYYPKALEYFPLLNALHKKFCWSLPALSQCKFYDKKGISVETFLFHAFIDIRDEHATRFFMRRGFSVIGTHDQYYDWTTRLEGNARCYRAVLTILGIARFHKKEQRDTLGMVARALWHTRGKTKWEATWVLH